MSFRRSSIVVTRVEPALQPEDRRHVLLVARPAINRHDGYDELDGFDKLTDVEWLDFAAYTVELAGQLARVAAGIALDLLGTAHAHCEAVPTWLDRRDTAEIPASSWGRSDEGSCGYWLSYQLDTTVGALDGYLPALEVCVPRNRERVWTERLESSLQRIATADAASFQLDDQ